MAPGDVAALLASTIRVLLPPLAAKFVVSLTSMKYPAAPVTASQLAVKSV